MCGIVGTVGQADATPILLEGLSRLEYRGYDSAGVAVVQDGKLCVEKAKGRLKNLCDRLEQRPTEDDVKRLEEAVNEVIQSHLPVTTEFISQQAAEGRFDLNRLPDDASSTVRVVKVGDYDECLCIGKHVANTSEIGVFKIISHDWNEEDKRWRIRFKLT